MGDRTMVRKQNIIRLLLFHALVKVICSRHSLGVSMLASEPIRFSPKLCGFVKKAAKIKYYKAQKCGEVVRQSTLATSKPCLPRKTDVKQLLMLFLLIKLICEITTLLLFCTFSYYKHMKNSGSGSAIFSNI